MGMRQRRIRSWRPRYAPSTKAGLHRQDGWTKGWGAGQPRRSARERDSRKSTRPVKGFVSVHFWMESPGTAYAAAAPGAWMGAPRRDYLTDSTG